MKATKATLDIQVQSLSVDAMACLVNKVMKLIDGETRSGTLEMDDGDCVSWEISTEKVEF